MAGRHRLACEISQIARLVDQQLAREPTPAGSECHTEAKARKLSATKREAVTPRLWSARDPTAGPCSRHDVGVAALTCLSWWARSTLWCASQCPRRRAMKKEALHGHRS